MKVGIYDIDRVSLTTRERFQIYKEIGFTHVGFYFDNDYLWNGETYLNLLKTADEMNLEVLQVHLDYKNSNMLSLGEDNDFLRYIEIKVDEAIHYGVKQLVLHASKGNEPPLISPYTLNRLKRLSKKLVKYNVMLCFENVRNNKNLDKVMEMNLENICVCYDSGHAHCYSNEKELLMKYREKIIATHIHDNFGNDDHSVIGNGSIEWHDIVSLLNETPRKVDYLECFPPRGVELDRERFIKFVKEVYEKYECFFGVCPQDRV